MAYSSPIQLLYRSLIDTTAWDACVAQSTGRMVYGLSWYLDAVTAAKGWRWAGLVLSVSDSTYRAVMPVPLRCKYGYWVVHQPLFCQFLDIYSTDPAVDTGLFLSALVRHFRYGSVLHLARLHGNLPAGMQCRIVYTHLLTLPDVSGEPDRFYAPDRRRQVRRSQSRGWYRQSAVDPSLLIRWFQHYHAGQIAGGVGDWAYAILRQLTGVLLERRTGSLWYVTDKESGEAQAGVLVVGSFGRMIYLFNAATPAGRAGHARAWLIDALLREVKKPVIFDFESPEVPAIARFYQEFGATPEPYYILRWNRLPWIVQWARRLLGNLK